MSRRAPFDERYAPHRAPRLGLPARLPIDLRARRRGLRRPHDRARARRRGQQLHGGRDLRQGRALRRAHPSSRPPDCTRCGGWGRRAPASSRASRGTRRSTLSPSGSSRRSARRPRGGLALLLRRHHGPRAARRHQPPAPRQEILRRVHDDLHQPGLDRLARRHRPARRRRSARDGEVRLRRDLGHERRAHPGQRDDARDARPQGARRQDRRRRHLRERHDAAGRPARSAAARHRRGARLRGDARAVPRRLRRPGLPRALHRLRRDELEAHLRHARRRTGRRRSPGCRSTRSRPSRGSSASTKRTYFRLGYGFTRSRNGAVNMHAALLHRRGHRRLAARGRRRLPLQRRHLPLAQDADRGARRARPDGRAMLDQSRIGRGADRRRRTRCAAGRRSRRCSSRTPIRSRSRPSRSW